MPLHALRHTAAASWLTTGHSLIFVARQLGHRSITTTEQHYGHLELNLFTNALAATEDAIVAPAATSTTNDAAPHGALSCRCSDAGGTSRGG